MQIEHYLTHSNTHNTAERLADGFRAWGEAQ